MQEAVEGRFGEVRGLNLFAAGEVGDGAGYLDNAGESAGAETQAVDDAFE